MSLQALKRNADAAAAYRRAVKLQSDYRAAWENLGVALQDQDDIDGALDAYRKAEAIDPRSAIAHLNIGALLMACGDIEEARAHFRILLDLMPAYGEAHLKYAVTSLACGDLAAGWKHYEWRAHAESYVAQNVSRTVPFPTWDGRALDDGALLITAEQGIGDELMFASCFADAAELVSCLVIECDPRLVSMFSRSFPDATVLSRKGADSFAWESQQPAIDYKIAAGSLPRLFRSKLDDFPTKTACLSVASERQTYWRQKLSDRGPILNIGVSWRGGCDALCGSNA